MLRKNTETRDANHILKKAWEENRWDGQVRIGSNKRVVDSYNWMQGNHSCLFSGSVSYLCEEKVQDKGGPSGNN